MESSSLGAKLRQVREEKKYTLKQVSSLSGLSTGFICQVELGQTDPSLSSLKRIAAALGIKLKDLFEQEECQQVLVRRNQGTILQVSPDVRCELLAHSIDKQMEPLIKTIEPGGKSGVVDGHPGEEFLWIIQGSLEVRVGDTRYHLEEGDSIYYSAQQAHAFHNRSGNACRVLWVITPPTMS